MDRETALAELERRKNKSQISKQDAMNELMRRKKVSVNEHPYDQSKSFLEQDAAILRPLVKDALKGAAKAVPSALSMAINLPGQAYDSAKLAYQNPELAKKNVKAGAASGLGGLLNVPNNIVNYLKENQMAPDWLTAWKPEDSGLLPQDFDYRKAEGLGEPQKGEELIYGLSQFAPAAVAGPLAPAAWAVGQNQNPVEAQLVPNVLKQAPGIAKQAYKSAKNIDLTPSGWIAKFNKDNLTLSELADNMRAAQGTETPLGDVLRSPKLKKKFENELATEADWEVEQTYRRINQQIQDKADSLLNERLGANAPSGDTNLIVKDMLTKAYDDHTTIKNNLYNDVNDTALAEKFDLQLPKFNKVIDNDVQALAQSPMLLADKELMGAFNDLIGVSGKKPTIKGAKIFASKFSTEAEALKNPDPTSRALKSLYTRVANALREDVKEQIASKGSKTLQHEFNIAESYYKNDFVQFLDKELYKLLDEGKDAQAIVSEIIQPGGAKDKYSLIKKVQDVLPNNQKNLLGYSYLRGAIDKDGVLHPGKMKQLIKKLGNRQFEALFPEATDRQALLDFSKLHDMNTEAASFLANPKTGARNTNAINKFRKYLIDAGIGGAAGVGAFGTLGAFLGVPVALLAKNATNKYLAKILTEEGFREKVVKKINESKKVSNKEPK